MTNRPSSNAERPDPNPDVDSLNDDARRIWNVNAEWWDDKIGDGNDFQIELVEPATERLLEIEGGQTILEIACGGGRFARRMADLGAHVTATDFSERFLARAKERTTTNVESIEYRVVDATDAEQLLALGAGRFDAAVASMALMDMASIEPLMSALPRLLKPGGRFVVSIMHPCFQSSEICKFAEMTESDGQYGVKSGIKISRYLTAESWKGIGIVGQPEMQWYFHRPLSTLFADAFANGLMIDGLEEPSFKDRPDDDRYLRWDNLPEIPPVLVVRMRTRTDTDGH